MAKMIVQAIKENLDEVLKFVEKEMSKAECTYDLQSKINIAVEEIFVNISDYAYSEDNGSITVICEIKENPFSVEIEFEDNGKQYNPLERQDPDIRLSCEERPIGGLGLYMVKKMMDNVEYKFENGKNIMKINKKIK